MAIIPQRTWFSWEEIEPLGDRERLQLVVETLSDEDLMRTLETACGRGRDDYPVLLSASEHRKFTPGTEPQRSVTDGLWLCRA